MFNKLHDMPCATIFVKCEATASLSNVLPNVLFVAAQPFEYSAYSSGLLALLHLCNFHSGFNVSYGAAHIASQEI